MGCKASTPLQGGERIIEAVRSVKGKRIALRLYVEEYGVHIEGEPLLPHDYNPLTFRFIREAAELIGGEKHVRLDLDENGWITVTGFVEDVNSLNGAIKELCEAYSRITKIII
ncbi:MAG: hypothetical protein QXK89_09805 [Candidatus Bathyarchaeia archaeon]